MCIKVTNLEANSLIFGLDFRLIPFFKGLILEKHSLSPIEIGKYGLKTKSSDFTVMNIKTTPLEGLLEIYPKVWKDSRGYFFESYRHDWLADHGMDIQWMQENQSFSKAGTVRGLHFQREPFAQAKLVRVISGRVLDVAVDLRKGSKTFGSYFAIELDAELHNMLLIPEGFAHGFSALEDSVFSYKCSNVYNKESEGGVLWNDPDLGIDWEVKHPILSEKDLELPTLREFIERYGGL